MVQTAEQKLRFRDKKDLENGVDRVVRSDADGVILEQVRAEIQKEVATGNMRLQNTTDKGAKCIKIASREGMQMISDAEENGLRKLAASSSSVQAVTAPAEQGAADLDIRNLVVDSGAFDLVCHPAVPEGADFHPSARRRGFPGRSPSKTTLTPTLSFNFPMNCVRVLTFMEFDVMPSYGQLLEKDLLVEPSDDATVHFISHEWLSRNHPDPDSKQLWRMQGVFLEILAGRSKKLLSPDDWITFSKGTSIGSQHSPLAAAENAQRSLDTITEDIFQKDIKQGLIWLDWSSIPQVLEAAKDSLEQTLKDQMAAVHSIGAYLDRCSYFWILAPTAIHKDQETIRDFTTYRSRAWCRLEEWANLLNSRSMMPLVVTEAPRIATYSSLTFVLDNARRPERGPCSGFLSCCSAGHSISIAGERRSIPCDKISMQSVLEKLYSAKMKSVANSLLAYPFSMLETSIAVGSDALAKPDLEEFDFHAEHNNNNNGNTLLHSAAATSNATMVRKLLDRRCKGEPWLVDAIGGTAFQSLAVFGCVAIAQLFLETGEIGKEQIDGHNSWGASPIHLTSEYGKPKMLQFLLANDAAVDLPKRKGSAYAGRTALHCAALRSQFECCEILLRHGASVRARDAQGATVLHMAALEPICLVGNQDPNAKMTTVRLLLEAQADPSARNDAGHTAAELLALASGHGGGKLWLTLCPRGT
ncbi:unnamed protein product [Polarella glacialis]|uniref:Uncharacterized protein n=1 Tax=Polarella glacialis TaxID=89957 RepID=A0A813LZD7_POLGL|nr:unnamed protein product [Polarella glacialis]